MTNLNNTIAIISRTGHEAALIAIDLETKTCLIRNGKEKTVTFTTAAGYKTSEGKVLSEIRLTNIATEDLETKTAELQKKTSGLDELEKKEQDGLNKLQKKADKAPKALKAKKEAPASEEEEVPQGITCTVAPDSANPDLRYIPDLADIVGCSQKVLRKKLRKLESDDKIHKVNHTWCWHKDSIDWTAIQEMLTKKEEK